MCIRDRGFSHAEEGRHARVGDGVVTASVADPAPEDVLADLPTPHELYAELSEHVVCLLYTSRCV